MPPRDSVPAIDAALRAAQEAWPRIEVDVAAFRQALGRWARAEPAALEHAADLYLAFGCVSGDRAATRALNELLVDQLPKVMARYRQPPSFVSDLHQSLLEKLLVGERARIRAYEGRGPLKAWLRSAAVREGLNMMRPRGVAGAVDARDVPQQGTEDPEVALIRRRFAAKLKTAVEGALGALPLEERNALRFYFIEGMTVEQIATLRGIHKSNVSRLIARVRRTVLEDVRRTLEGSLGLASKELESMMRLVQSQLHVSVERALKRKD